MSLKNKKVLITCGPTWVAVDSMRVISNRSTGTLGRTLAEDFTKEGAKVTLLEGPVTRPLVSKSIRILKFTFFDELVTLIKGELKKQYDVCIHAAAVSDYKVKNALKTKLSSQLKTLRLDLVPTPKIINQIKRLNPNLILIGFKLETKITKATAQKKSRALFQEGKCDLVVANCLNGNKYAGYIIDPNKCLAFKRSRRHMSKTLVDMVKRKI